MIINIRGPYPPQEGELFTYSLVKYSFAAVAALHIVDGLPRPGGKVGFPEGLTASGMSVADAGNVFTGGAVFKSKSSFVNHLSGSWSNDVRPQESVCGLLPKDLHQAICVVVALGPAVRRKRKLSNVVGDAVGLLRQHGALDDVADGVDVGEDCLESGVDGHPAPVVPLNPHLLQSQVVCVGTTSHADQQNIGL